MKNSEVRSPKSEPKPKRRIPKACGLIQARWSGPSRNDAVETGSAGRAVPRRQDGSPDASFAPRTTHRLMLGQSAHDGFRRAGENGPRAAGAPCPRAPFRLRIGAFANSRAGADRAVLASGFLRVSDPRLATLAQVSPPPGLGWPAARSGWLCGTLVY
jgi:hypothetical protein